MAGPEKRKQKKNGAVRSRVTVLLAIMGVAMFIILGYTLWHIMIDQHEYYTQQAVEQQTYQSKVTASRGMITDCNGNTLAVSITTYNVFISPYEIQENGEDIDMIAENLSKILNIEKEGIITRNENKNSWYEVVAWEVSQEVADRVSAFKQKNGLVGVHLEDTFTRYYPYESLGCHVLGFIGSEGKGLYGVEEEYDSYLRGSDGYKYYVKTGDGHILSQTESTATDGSHVELTIDVNIQAIAEKYLQQAVREYEVENGGTCIIMDVRNGDILALANADTYDPNQPLEVSADVQKQLETITDDDEYNTAMADARIAQWSNYAVHTGYEPGSVFKTITLAMALEDGTATLDTAFDCEGSVEILGRDDPLHCWNRTGHGILSLPEAVKQSCNVAFAEIGLSIGAQRFYDYVEAFGLFEKTGIDLDGETSSTWWSEDVFFNTDNYSQLTAASFGQTFSISPIQMITAIAAATNGGYLLEPHVVNTITDPDGNIVYSRSTNVVRQVISSETSATVCELLKNVVADDDGTGHNAAVQGYSIAGKTGTSEKTGTETEEGIEDYAVSFCGVSPADNPAIAVLVILDTPGTDTGTAVSGGAMAAPVAGSVFAETLAYLGYEPDMDAEAGE